MDSRREEAETFFKEKGIGNKKARNNDELYGEKTQMLSL